MMTHSFQQVAAQLQFFQEVEKKERFLFVLGALTAKLISLHKAAEIMELDPKFLLNLLNLLGIEHSYFSETDIELEEHSIAIAELDEFFNQLPCFNEEEAFTFAQDIQVARNQLIQTTELWD